MKEWFRRYYHHLIKLVTIAAIHPEQSDRFEESREDGKNWTKLETNGGVANLVFFRKDQVIFKNGL